MDASTRMWGAAVGLALLVARATLAPLGAQEVASAVDLEACPVAGHAGEARCGTVAVWEDSEAKAGQRIGLNVMVLMPTSPAVGHLPDPVFVLDGGPGQAATRAVGWVMVELAAVLETRAIVLVDRRGTGGSNPLDCPGEAGADGTPARVPGPPSSEWLAECLRALESRADLTKYTSPYAADDLDAVRQALGYDRINLYGGSYGSREALEYMRRYPEHLRAAAVFAVTPQHERALLWSPSSAERALQRLMDDCMAEAACRAAYPSLRRELREVVDRLEREPATFTVALPGDGLAERLELTRERWAGLVRSILLSPAGGAQVPYLIHQTWRGEYEQVGGLYVRLARSMPAAMSRGLFLSVICAEEMARTSPEEIGPAAEGTFWGPGWVEDIKRQCEGWPVGRLPESWYAPPSGETPFLLLAGWLDPIAPPAWAAELTRWMPNARRVLVRAGHHSFRLDTCAGATLARFYDTADAVNLDTACIATLKRPAFLVPAADPAGPSSGPDGATPGGARR